MTKNSGTSGNGSVRKIAVIGDMALDFSYFAETSNERSVETGLTVEDVRKYNYDCGGAANLAADIASLGMPCDIYGVVGEDIFADILEDKLKELSVGTCHIARQKDFTTFVYHKHYDMMGNELPRYDLGKTNKYDPKVLDGMLEDLCRNIGEYGAIVINQQIPNSIHLDASANEFRKGLSKILESFNGSVWVDSRNDIMYPNSSYKFNLVEAKAKTGEDLAQKAAELFLKRKPSPKAVVITMGKEGAFGTNGTDSFRILGINDVKKTDPVGAGDAFLAGLVAAQVRGLGLKESLEYANANASISAGVLFSTGHPTQVQTQTLLEDPDYRYNPTLAKDPRLARYLDGTDIEIVNAGFEHPKAGEYPKVAIFDHDGTISTMRHGWEKIMRRMMVQAIAGDRFDSIAALDLDKMYSSVDAMIEKTTGIQTIVQMSQLIDMIRDYGYVPENEIKTPLQYKDEYRSLLNEQLKCKYKRFEEGIYNVYDLTMKGALDFLAELGKNGTKVFLASGSDYTDVKYETHALGYDLLFTGGIFGSVSNLSKDPKKMVMGEIIKNIDADSSQVVVFGDGPVEMREAKKRGFLTVGIISDEHQRFGMNPAKRERLILAGADILIPDFSWMKILESHLGWRK